MLDDKGGKPPTQERGSTMFPLFVYMFVMVNLC